MGALPCCALTAGWFCVSGKGEGLDDPHCPQLQTHDRVVAALRWGEPYTEEDEQAMAQLLQMMLEPSLLPVYKTLDEEFYEKYLV